MVFIKIDIERYKIGTLWERCKYRQLISSKLNTIYIHKIEGHKMDTERVR